MPKQAINFRPIEEVSYSEIKEHYQKYPLFTSDTQWTNLWIWRKTRPIFIYSALDTFLFFILDEEKNYLLFGPPLGSANLNDLLETLPFDLKKMIRITTKELPFLKEYQIHSLADHADYIYKVEDLANFTGKKYAKKRQLIHQIENKKNWEYLPFSPLEKETCFSFYVDCLKLYDGLSYEKEYLAGKELFSLIPTHSFEGALLKIDGKIAAFILGETLNEHTFLGHLEKNRLEINGSLPFLLYQFAKNFLLSKYTYFNFEQDLGIKGLKTYKERLFPDHMTLKWQAYL